VNIHKAFEAKSITFVFFETTSKCGQGIHTNKVMGTMDHHVLCWNRQQSSYV